MEHLNSQQLAVMLCSLGLLIGLARMLGEIAQRFRQPAVLGELLAGVLLGPTVFGALAPDWQTHLFPAAGPTKIAVDGIASLAIVLFLLVAGMEVDLSLVWKQGRTAIKVGVLGTVIPFAIGLLAALIMPGALGREAEADPRIFALFIATAMAISALPVIARTLMDLNLYRTDLGMIVVSAAIFNDLIGWTVFAVILGMIGQESAGPGIAATVALTLLFAGLMLTVGRWLIHRSLPALQAYTHWPGGVLGFAVTIALFGAAFTELIGVHAIFGSFIVGVALGESRHLQERTRKQLDEFVSFIFAPVFFASIGLRINFATSFDAKLTLLVLVLACSSKLLGAVLGARWGGMSIRDRWAVGFAMNARGAMEIILGLLALNAGVIRQPLFVALVLTAIITSALGGPLIHWALRDRRSLDLLDCLSSRLFTPRLAGSTRQQAVSELVAMAAAATRLEPAVLERAVWAREEVVATGIGYGVALPHARVVGLSGPVVAVGVSDGGVDFDAPDGQLAHVLFLLLTPDDDPSVQLDLCAEIARMFREPHVVERVLRAENFTEFLAVLKMLPSRDRSPL